MKKGKKLIRPTTSCTGMNHYTFMKNNYFVLKKRRRKNEKFNIVFKNDFLCEKNRFLKLKKEIINFCFRSSFLNNILNSHIKLWHMTDPGAGGGLKIANMTIDGPERPYKLCTFQQ